jgi:hypothetical protein
MSLGEDRVVHYSKIGGQLTPLGQSRPARTGSRSVHVRFAFESGSKITSHLLVGTVPQSASGSNNAPSIAGASAGRRHMALVSEMKPGERPPASPPNDGRPL